MQELTSLLQLPLFQNGWTDWLLAGLLATGIFFLLVVLRRVARRHHQKLLTTERVELLEVPLEVAARTTLLFFVAVALFTGLNTLDMSPKTRLLIQSALTIALFLQAGLWAGAATSGWLERKQRSSITTDRAVAGSLGIISFIAKAVIWVLVVLLTLDNLGINITALVAGLGIGGIAVALALQNILGDLFASLSITFDKPFYLGDFLIIDDFLGSVEHIGIKSTRLRSLSGEQIIVSNADLLKSRLRNYGRMSERRVLFTTGVTYETRADDLEKIPALIRRIIEGQADTRFDRSHFARHAAAAIEFETVYYVLSADYNRYMDIQQVINLRIHRELARLGVEFAYPTQRILVERGGQRPQKMAAAAVG